MFNTWCITYSFWRERWICGISRAWLPEPCMSGQYMCLTTQFSNSASLETDYKTKISTNRLNFLLSVYKYNIFPLESRRTSVWYFPTNLNFHKPGTARLKSFELRVPSNRKELDVATRLSAESWWQTVCHTPPFLVVSIPSPTQNQWQGVVQCPSCASLVECN